ncbi:FbpB family small basic protein [Oceanobacillus senegalensis]|nr:FbpB family small basic protein [Oceanobacillus senegalensis]
MKKKLTFEELVKENRREILEDSVLLDEIDEKLEKKARQSLKEAK